MLDIFPGDLIQTFRLQLWQYVMAERAPIVSPA
jgi:hypothetical protein